MNLPETTILNFFNKVLIALTQLTIENNFCSTESLIYHCKSFTLGGQRGEYESVLEHCQNCGLVQIKKENIVLSALGQKFLDANPYKYFEITESQKQFISERIIFKGAWNHYARQLFKLFYLNQGTERYEFSTIENSLPNNENMTAHFLKYLGILEEEDLIIYVNKKYSEPVYLLTADSKAIYEQQLEKILMENRKLGAKAEIAIVEFEKQRLKKLGKYIQAELVKRISVLNAAAGYDIESFDGNSDDISPNRFIEVKATHGNEIRFYWSNNEMKIAKTKKDSYWIYMMKNFSEDKPKDAFPIKIKNPILEIERGLYLSMEAHTFLINEIADVELKEYSIDDVKWYEIA